MKHAKIYVCVKGPGSGDEIDMVLASNQFVSDFIKICIEVLRKDISLVQVNHPFSKSFTTISSQKTFYEAGVTNGDILMLF